MVQTQTRQIILTATDSHKLDACLCSPMDEVKGGLILIHEVFGMTEQLQQLAKHFAGLGIKTIIPALFDRIETGVSLSYDNVEEGRRLAGQCQRELLLMDIQAALEAIDLSKVAVVGYCWGGGIAYLAACHLSLCCGASYYGTRIASYLDKQPPCPFQFHFGGLDQAIPESDIEDVRKTNPGQDVFIYPNANHAFANADRPNFDRDSSELAEQRLLQFLMSNFNSS